MKQSIARQHPQHRNSTPSVIYLPSPKPPVVAKRSAPVPEEAAIALPDTPEPLVSERTEVATPQTPNPNRQARRKALRAEAKALRRQGQPPAPIVAAKTQALIPATAPAAVVAPPAAAPLADSPLPRALSLVAAKPRGVALFAQRLRGFFGIARANAASGPTETMIASQLRTLRSELAVLQRSIDQIIDRAPA